MGRMWPDPKPAGGPLPKPKAGDRRRPPPPKRPSAGQYRKPPPPPPHRSRNGPPNKDNFCCPMVAALASVKRGKYKLAARYARWSVRLIAARI